MFEYRLTESDIMRNMWNPILGFMILMVSMSNVKRCGKLECLKEDARLQINMDMDKDLT